jgi:hypothetical protein
VDFYKLLNWAAMQPIIFCRDETRSPKLGWSLGEVVGYQQMTLQFDA